MGCVYCFSIVFEKRIFFFNFVTLGRIFCIDFVCVCIHYLNRSGPNLTKTKLPPKSNVVADPVRGELDRRGKGGRESRRRVQTAIDMKDQNNFQRKSGGRQKNKYVRIE